MAILYKHETGLNPLNLSYIKRKYFAHFSDLDEGTFNNLLSYFKFTVVRNPISRIKSSYLNKIVRGKPQSQLLITRKSIAEGNKVSFDDFLDYLELGGISENPHWCLQKDLLLFPVENYDAICKVENLPYCIVPVFQRIYGVNVNLITKNEHKTNSSEFLLNSNQKERIKKLYYDDFETFGYPV